MCVDTCDSGRHSNNQFWYSSSLFYWLSYFRWLTDPNSNHCESLSLKNIDWFNSTMSMVWWKMWKNTHTHTQKCPFNCCSQHIYALYVPRSFGPWEFSFWMFLLRFFFVQNKTRQKENSWKRVQINVHVHRKTMRCWMALQIHFHARLLNNCTKWMQWIAFAFQKFKEWTMCSRSVYSLFSRESERYV